MKEVQYIDRLNNAMRGDNFRMNVLSIVRSLMLPDCYVAAGFVRNCIWDVLHDKQTPLNDIDIVFFDRADPSGSRAKKVSKELNRMYPEMPWQVKNQAIMHLKNGDEAYHNTEHAMSYWPEKETAVGIAMNEDDSLSVASVFGLSSLFNGEITHNSNREISVFFNRVKNKQWQEQWPQLKLVY